MSTRYLKKVYGSDITLEENLENERESSHIQVGSEKKKQFNVFDLVITHKIVNAFSISLIKS